MSAICCIPFPLCPFLSIISKLVGADAVTIISASSCNILNSCARCAALNVKMKNLDISSSWLFTTSSIF